MRPAPSNPLVWPVALNGDRLVFSNNTGCSLINDAVLLGIWWDHLVRSRSVHSAPFACTRNAARSGRRTAQKWPSRPSCPIYTCTSEERNTSCSAHRRMSKSGISRCLKVFTCFKMVKFKNEKWFVYINWPFGVRQSFAYEKERRPIGARRLRALNWISECPHSLIFGNPKLARIMSESIADKPRWAGTSEIWPEWLAILPHRPKNFD